MRDWLAAAALCLLVGCAEGRRLDYEDVQAKLKTWQPSLIKAVADIERCKPQRFDGYDTFWLNGDDGGSGRKIACATNSPDGLSAITADLADTSVIGVQRARKDGSIEFILYRDGIVTSGTLTTLNYHPAPRQCSDDNFSDGGWRTTERPLTPSPCHWFWYESAN